MVPSSQWLWEYNGAVFPFLLAVLQLCSEVQQYVPRDACALDSLRSFPIAACLPFQRWSPVYVGQSVCPPVGHERRQHVLLAFVHVEISASYLLYNSK